jgi:hypothetical protein
MKLKTYLSALLLSIIGIFSPIVPLMLTVGFLIAVDFVMALYKAHKKKEKITSRKMYNSVPKIFIYNLMIISVFLLEKYIIQSGIPIEKVAATAIGLTEIKSVMESFYSLTGIDLLDKFKDMFSRGESKTKSKE